MPEVTIREVLDGIRNGTRRTRAGSVPGYPEATNLLAKRVEAVLKLHQKAVSKKGKPMCLGCAFAPWPCSTIRALDGE